MEKKLSINPEYFDRKKIQDEFLIKREEDRSPSREEQKRYSKEEELIRVYDLYKQKGNLAAIGREIGISRELVRQRLVSGSQRGLFKYKQYIYPKLSKEKILKDYQRYLNLNAVAEANGVSSRYLRKLFASYNITRKDRDSLRMKRLREDKKNQCMELYDEIVKDFGHHPTTRELHHSKWNHFYFKVLRLWGSYGAFREEMAIPKALPFVEATRKWREYRSNRAVIVRAQQIDQVRECLKTSGPLSLFQIAYNCNIPEWRVRQLLKSLREAKEVIKEKKERLTKYRLLKS